MNKFLKDPKRVVNVLAARGVLNFLPDEQYLKLRYWAAFGRKLDLENPSRFTEKLQWLKLHDRKPEYSRMVDKYEAKQYVADKIGEEYIIPTLGVWDSFDEIDFESLPDKFVLKCTHDSGGLVICKDKKSLDKDKARTKIEKSLKNNYYLWGREWPYKNVKPRIIAEQFMVDSKTEDLRDFKFFCFGGQVRCFKVDFDRFIEHRANYYDEKSHILNFGEVMCPPDYNKKIELPKSIGKMEKLAQKLAEEHPFLRADFYDVDGKVYFGEMTFYPASGFGAFTDDEWDKLLGSWIPMGGGQLLITKQLIIILEKRQMDLIDYKFYCFNGIPQYCQVIKNRSTYETIDFFDMEWHHQNFTGIGVPLKPHSTLPVQCPHTFIKMKEMAEVLAEKMKFVRVDFYEINGKMYFGEITFYPASGFGALEPEDTDAWLGKLLRV